MARDLVIYISDWTWKHDEPIEEETTAWLGELGGGTPTFTVDQEAGNLNFPVQFTVSAHPMPDAATEDALVTRLRQAWDVTALTSAGMSRRQALSAIHEHADQENRRRAVGYDDAGYRDDLPAHLRPLLDEPAGAALRARPAPTYAPPDPDYMRRLGEADEGMYLWDHQALWKHRAQPQQPGMLIFECNDDGLRATDDPELVSHVYGLDMAPPCINQFERPVLVDDLVAQICFDTHERLRRDADGLLLRKSFFSSHIDYDNSLLNPGWTPHAAVGAMTGWAVHPETSPPRVEPLGANNSTFVRHLTEINGYLATIGATRIEWALAHDLILTGRRIAHLDDAVVRFICDLLIDLIVADSGYLYLEPDEPWDARPADAVPMDQPLLRAELIVEGATLYQTRHRVWEFASGIRHPFSTAVYRSPWTSAADSLPANSIRVAVETVTGDEAQRTLQRLVALLNTSAEITTGNYVDGWTTHTLSPLDEGPSSHT